MLLQVMGISKKKLVMNTLCLDFSQEICYIMKATRNVLPFRKNLAMWLINSKISDALLSLPSFVKLVIMLSF